MGAEPRRSRIPHRVRRQLHPDEKHQRPPAAAADHRLHAHDRSDVVASRASGATLNQGLGGAPVAGTFNQNITPQNVVQQQLGTG